MQITLGSFKGESNLTLSKKSWKSDNFQPIGIATFVTFFYLSIRNELWLYLHAIAAFPPISLCSPKRELKEVGI